MTQHLPPSLLSLFAPRPPIPFMPPVERGELPPYAGISQFVSLFEDPSVNPSGAGRDPFETKTTRKKRLIREKLAKHKETLAEASKNYNPTADPKATGDPYRTLFVGKINFNTTDHKLKREFEIYGPIKKVRVVQDEKGKPRGYAFIEYEKERDMKSAARQADGKKIDGRRVLVDSERGRTQRDWRPRKYGGGLGYTRATSEERETLIRAERERESSRDREPRGEREEPRDRDRHRDPRERENRGEGAHSRHSERERGPERDRGDRSRDRERGHGGDRGGHHGGGGDRSSFGGADRGGPDRANIEREKEEGRQRGEKRPREREGQGREERY